MLALDLALLWGNAGQQIEGTESVPSALITPAVVSLQPGAVATPEGWRSLFRSLGYLEIDANSTVRPGEFRFGQTSWTVQPQGGPPLVVEVNQRKVRSLRDRDDGLSIARWDFRLPALSLTDAISALHPESKTSREPIEARLSFRSLPTSLVHAVLAHTDPHFFGHHGIDPRQLARNSWRRIQGKDDRALESTLPQRLAADLLEEHEAGLARALQATLLSLVLDFRYEKERLLSEVLDRASFIGREGQSLAGVAAAASHWFGKEPPSLQPHEAALLAAALPGSDGRLPFTDLESAQNLRDRVLRQMLQQGRLNPAETARALSTRVSLSAPVALDRRASWIIDAVQPTRPELSGSGATGQRISEVQTTLFPPLQQAAQEAVHKELETLRLRFPQLFSGAGELQISLLAIEPGSGAIRALARSPRPSGPSPGPGLLVEHSPGAAFRPLVLASAISDGDPRVSGARAGPLKTSPARLVSVARTLGITSPLSDEDGLLEGAQPVRLVDLAVSLSTLANDGLRPEAHLLVGVRAESGAWLHRRLPVQEAALDPRVAAAVTRQLQDFVDPNEARALRTAGFEFPVAFQSGRSPLGDGVSMIGYTPDLVTVAWIGAPVESSDTLPLPLSAAPLWTRFLVAASPFLSGDSFSGDLDQPAPSTPTTGSASIRPVSPGSPHPSHLEREDSLRRNAEKSTGLDIERSLR